MESMQRVGAGGVLFQNIVQYNSHACRRKALLEKFYTPPLASGITAITNKACSSTQRQSLPQGISLQLKVAHAKMGSGRKRDGGRRGGEKRRE